MTRVVIQNRQKAHRVDRKTLRETLVRLMECVGNDKIALWESVTVILVDDYESGDIHEKTFGDPSPTDVITLSYRDGISGKLSGELIVNVQRAAEEGNRRPAWGFDKELALYLAHGLDHLTGENDDTPASRRRMRQRELRWLKKVGNTGFNQVGKQEKKKEKSNRD